MNWLTDSQRSNLNIFLKIEFQHTFNVLICCWLNLSAPLTYTAGLANKKIVVNVVAASRANRWNRQIYSY